MDFDYDPYYHAIQALKSARFVYESFACESLVGLE